MGLLLASDHITGSNGGDISSGNQLKGDLFALLGATFYGLCNVYEEWFVSGRPLYEVLLHPSPRPLSLRIRRVPKHFLTHRQFLGRDHRDTSVPSEGALDVSDCVHIDYGGAFRVLLWEGGNGGGEEGLVGGGPGTRNRRVRECEETHET
jgi:hypothetical protein